MRTGGEQYAVLRRNIDAVSIVLSISYFVCFCFEEFNVSFQNWSVTGVKNREHSRGCKS